MKISPRYDAAPLVRLDGAPDAIGGPMLRQRRRLAKIAAELTPEQWAIESRCADWRVQDVFAHLTGVDQFWNMAIQSGVAGKPTRVLASFDPKATPAAMVDRVREEKPEQALASYLAANETLCATVESLDKPGWEAIGESPIGDVTISTLAHHALWDCWIHERDVLEPLGIKQEIEPDEVTACLRYAAALAPAFALQADSTRRGALALEATNPDALVAVKVDGDVEVTAGTAPADALALSGDAVELVEALSIRAPLSHRIPADQGWLVSALAEVFEAEPVG